MNVPSLLAADDPGNDGHSSGNHTHVGRDAFGMVLGFHGKDFVHTGSVIDSAGAGTWQQLPQTSLYNGNIASWSWNTQKTDGTLLGALASTYRYDLLNRLRADTVRTRGVSSWDSPAGKFRSAYTYDGNGNILTLDRKDDAGSHLDQLRYRYTPGMNRMTHVDELGGSTATAGDIEDQDTLNYAYDGAGNMTQDVSEGINASGIVWTPSNKIRSITKAGSSPTSKLEYLYDAMGNRVVKRYYEPSNTLVSTTWYVRDAQGNVLGIYEKLAASGNVVAKENPIYGASRIGEWRTGAFYSATATDTLVANDVVYSRLLGNKRYELTDHLGNVRVAISDVLLDHSGSPDAEVVSYTDYHPFGMAMTNRTWQAGDYRFGYNGQENDNEISREGNHVNYIKRVYDTRIARFMSVDPIADQYPMLTPYQFASNTPIWAVDRDGEEARIYIETRGTGHAFLSVQDDKDIVVYTYGRYGGSDWYTMGATGEGVLVRFTGQQAINYVTTELHRMNAQVFEVRDVKQEKVKSYLDRLYHMSKVRPTTEDSDILRYGKVINDYSLFGCNCTTLSSDALKMAGTGIFEVDGWLYDYDEDFSIPSSLLDYMSDRAKSDPTLLNVTETMKKKYPNTQGIDVLKSAGSSGASSGIGGSSSGSSANSSSTNTSSSGNGSSSSGQDVNRITGKD